MAFAAHCCYSSVRVVIVLLFKRRISENWNYFCGFSAQNSKAQLLELMRGLHIGVDCGRNDFGQLLSRGESR